MNKEEFFEKLGDIIDKNDWMDRDEEIEAIESVGKNSVTIKLYGQELHDGTANDPYACFAPGSVVGYCTFTKRMVRQMAKIKSIVNKSACPHILSISCGTVAIENIFRVELCEDLEEMLGDKEDLLETIEVYAFGVEAYCIQGVCGNPTRIRFPLNFGLYGELLGIPWE